MAPRCYECNEETLELLCELFQDLGVYFARKACTALVHMIDRFCVIFCVVNPVCFAVYENTACYYPVKWDSVVARGSSEGSCSVDSGESAVFDVNFKGILQLIKTKLELLSYK